jgi:hypothetical protein
MSDIGSTRPAVDTTAVAYSSEPDQTGWTGWIVFASFMMFMLGSFQIVQGIVAIFDDGYYAVTSKGLLVNVDYTAWGWVHLVLGLLVIGAAAGLLAGNMAARIVAVLLAGISAIVNLAFIEAYPIWGVIIIAVDVMVIYAVTVHGRELHTSAT